MLHERQRREVAGQPPRSPRSPRVHPLIALQQAAGNRAVAQLMRKVKVEGQEYASGVELWFAVRDFVTSRYGRRKALLELYESNDGKDWGMTLAQLAEQLDKPFTKKAQRGRPDWTPKLKQELSGTDHGRKHRRHVVMSSQMRDAVYSVSDVWSVQDATRLLDTYNALLQLVGLSAGTWETAETELVRVLHNNPQNLILDEGDWNSGIGALAHNAKQTLISMPAPWTTVSTAPNFGAAVGQLLDGLVHGFQVPRQQEIIAFWKQFAAKNPPDSERKLRNLLEDIYDNAAADLMSKESTSSVPIGELLGCHSGFVAAEGTGDLKTLKETAARFITLGLSGKPSYGDIL